MENLQRIENLVTYQKFYNREKEIKDLYREEERKLEKLKGDNTIVVNQKKDIEVNITEMNKKINEEIGRRDDINKRINSLNDGKDKIKIARQVKSWEKEMEKQQQEQSLIQAQIDYDGNKMNEFKTENDRLAAKLEENNKKITELEAQVGSIKEQYKGELLTIESEKVRLKDEFDVQFIEYFEALLVKTGGTAIVEIDEDACMGCYTILPTRLQGELGAEMNPDDLELNQCPHCFRYLYFKVWLEKAA